MIAVRAAYTAAEVARHLFGREVEWFYKHRQCLETREDFPQPIAMVGQPRWSGAALIDWRDQPNSADDRGVGARMSVGGVDRVLHQRTQAMTAKACPGAGGAVPGIPPDRTIAIAWRDRALSDVERSVRPPTHTFESILGESAGK